MGQTGLEQKATYTTTNLGAGNMEITLRLDDNQAKKLMMVTVVNDTSVEKYTNDVLINHLDSIDSKTIMNGVEKLFGEVKQQTPRKKQHRNNGNEILTIPKSYQRDYMGLELSRCNIISVGKKRTQKLTLDINDALVIVEHGEYTFNEFKELQKELNVTQPMLYRFMWNVDEGNLNSLITDFKSKMGKVFFSVQDNTLYCNSESVCDLFDAQIIISSFANRNCGKEREIWELIRNYPHIDELHLRILCENYTNEDLLRFINQRKEVVVENNREKRANLLMNGGI